MYVVQLQYNYKQSTCTTSYSCCMPTDSSHQSMHASEGMWSQVLWNHSWHLWQVYRKKGDLEYLRLPSKWLAMRCSYHEKSALHFLGEWQLTSFLVYLYCQWHCMIDDCFAGLIDESVIGMDLRTVFRYWYADSSVFYKKYDKTRTGLRLYTLSIGPLVRSGSRFIAYRLYWYKLFCNSSRAEPWHFSRGGARQRWVSWTFHDKGRSSCSPDHTDKT